MSLKVVLLGLWRRIITSPVTERAWHTFWQTFIAVFVVGIPAVALILKIHGLDAAQAALVSLITASAAAGLSALKTMIVSRKG